MGGTDSYLKQMLNASSFERRKLGRNEGKKHSQEHFKGEGMGGGYGCLKIIELFFENSVIRPVLPR